MKGIDHVQNHPYYWHEQRFRPRYCRDARIFASAQQPADADRIAAYGELGGIPTRIGQTIADSFKGENAPNPHDVAEVIAKLVAQPSGSRPARVVAGQSFGADVINAQVEAVQTQLLEALGLTFLAQPPAVSAGA
jgi:hypothetical protein